MNPTPLGDSWANAPRPEAPRDARRNSWRAAARFGQSIVRLLLGSSLGPLVALVAVTAVFAVLLKLHGGSGQLVSPDGLRLILSSAASVGIAALGMTLIIIAGGIDLSAGTAMALCATVTAACVVGEAPIQAALAAGVATGAAAGLINGALVSALRVVPFIVTLGTMTIFRGVAQQIAISTTGGSKIRSSVPPWVVEIQLPYAGWLVCEAVWLMLLGAVVAAVVLHLTVFGRHLFALGSNESTARLCGIPIHRTRIGVYTLAGVFIGIAGVLQFCKMSGQGDPMGGDGKELQIIAAVVIGGGSLSGGRGSVLGTLCGAVMMAVIELGCRGLEYATHVQQIIIGVIIIAAVSLDQYRQRWAQR